MRKWFLFLTYSVIGIFANTGCGNDYPNNQNFGYRFGYSTYYRPGYARNFNNSETWKATCYLLMTEDIGITFWHAEGKCNHWAKDGHLASIRSEEENKLVTDLAAKKNIDKEQPWIGGMISEVVGGWAWTDFDPFADFAGYLTNVPAGQVEPTLSSAAQRWGTN
ncbi:unnamed protein product, partial [Mesorhabditis belari]|uniref:C-type lectin domain-containing protein n=1 Tax=Mesorhabditis belari TaxID=2138241 RepID=A0AAF3FQG1_9BILA